MNLYLDDDSIDHVLSRLLSIAGHDVLRSVDAGMQGQADPLHYIRAIHERRVVVTGNRKDFVQLHELILVANGHHFGVIAVNKENNPRRDFTPRGIVNALRKLEATGMQLPDQFINLNDWRA